MTKQNEFAFSSVPIPERETKPRKKGLTMMIDWGIPLELQEDCIEGQGLYVDEAKIAGSIPRVMPKEYLTQKISAYKAADIFTFPGGLFTELAIAQGNFDVFLEEIKTMGFSGIEVSDNLIKIDPKSKKETILKAVNEYGLTVMGEVGRKEGVMSDDELVADIENCLEAGASMVLIEAHELFHGDIRQDALDAIAKNAPMEKIMFELPVTVLPDITKTYKTKILYWMISQFGTEVNLANVEWDEIYFTEISRRGGSGRSTHPESAFRLAGVDTIES